jgi:uncharacterized protein YndB with AHSA1/START domain
MKSSKWRYTGENKLNTERKSMNMNNSITSKMKIMTPAHEIFEALANPEKMANFWFSSGTDRIGEGKTITWRYDEYKAEGMINVLEVIEDKKIVFKWGDPAHQTKVSISLEELDNTSTIIEVNESGFNGEDNEKFAIMLGQKEGWVYMLTCLKAYLENGISTLRASLVHN